MLDIFKSSQGVKMSNLNLSHIWKKSAFSRFENHLKALMRFSTNSQCFRFKVFRVKRILNDCVLHESHVSAGPNNKFNCEM